MGYNQVNLVPVAKIRLWLTVVRVYKLYLLTYIIFNYIYYKRLDNQCAVATHPVGFYPNVYTFGYAIAYSSVCRLAVYRLSLTFVHPTQPVEIFGNVSTPFSTIAIC